LDIAISNFEDCTKKAFIVLFFHIKLFQEVTEVTMVQSKAIDVETYLNELPEERRTVVSELRKIILDKLPSGYQETLNWGMISYEVPLSRYPHTYNKKPLLYAAVAAQKNYYSLYLMTVRGSQDRENWLKEEFHKAGKKLDMGKACLRFRQLEDLPLGVIGQFIASVPLEKYIETYESLIKRS
jgi:hypothetical protein